jgi:hypothetical protein
VPAAIAGMWYKAPPRRASLLYFGHTKRKINHGTSNLTASGLASAYLERSQAGTLDTMLKSWSAQQEVIYRARKRNVPKHWITKKPKGLVKYFLKKARKITRLIMRYRVIIIYKLNTAKEFMMKEKIKTSELVERVMDYTRQIDIAMPLMSWSEAFIERAVIAYRNVGRRNSWRKFACGLQTEFIKKSKRFGDWYAEDQFFGRIAFECKWIDEHIR